MIRQDTPTVNPCILIHHMSSVVLLYWSNPTSLLTSTASSSLSYIWSTLGQATHVPNELLARLAHRDVSFDMLMHVSCFSLPNHWSGLSCLLLVNLVYQLWHSHLHLKHFPLCINDHVVPLDYRRSSSSYSSSSSSSLKSTTVMYRASRSLAFEQEHASWFASHPVGVSTPTLLLRPPQPFHQSCFLFFTRFVYFGNNELYWHLLSLLFCALQLLSSLYLLDSLYTSLWLGSLCLLHPILTTTTHVFLLDIFLGLANHHMH